MSHRSVESWRDWDYSFSGWLSFGDHSCLAESVLIRSHWPPLDVIGSILGITLQGAQTWKRKSLRQPWSGTKAGAGGGRLRLRGQRLALARALRMRQTIQNSQNEPGMCPRINNLTFWRLTSPSQIGRRGQLGRSQRGSPGGQAESQPTLTAKELNELHRLSC